jgi:phage-related minor tail protein
VMLSSGETGLLRREIRDAEKALASARTSAEPLRALGEMTNAIETLTATQHELVNVLLDRGATWSMIAEALSTSSAGAKRRYPRRSARGIAAP